MADRIDPISGKRREKNQSERGWRFYATIVVLVLALLFIVQNTDSTQITFLFAQTDMPLFFALIIAMLLGAAIGWLTPKVRRSNKVEREKLP